MGDEPFVVTELELAASIRVRGVEDSYPRCRTGGDRLERKLVVAVVSGRHPHAPEPDPELRRVKPSRAPDGFVDHLAERYESSVRPATTRMQNQ
jgi:hypothetical protein